MGSATEIADLAEFLISGQSLNITGQTIMIDGGYIVPEQRE